MGLRDFQAGQEELKMGRHESNALPPVPPVPPVHPLPQRGGLSRGKRLLITSLTNSTLYFIENVFIIVKGNGKSYRLFVCHHNEVLADECYESLRGAKIAFSKLFQYKTFLNSQPKWSPLYSPEKAWLDKMSKVCDEYLRCNGLSKPMEYIARTAP